MSETATVSVRPAREVVAEELRALLGRRRITASELARRMEVSQPYISRRLTGETAFDIDDLQKIAQILEVEIVDLFPREGHVVYAGQERSQTTSQYFPSAKRRSPVGWGRSMSPPSQSAEQRARRRPKRVLQPAA